MVDIRYDTPAHQDDFALSRPMDSTESHTESHKEAIHKPGILSRFRIQALHHKFTLDITIRDNKLLLIGDNGTGKSTVLNFMYFFLTNQWQRMLNYDFKSIFAVIDGNKIFFTRSEILEGKAMVPPIAQRVLYLPAYRTIEHDLRSLPPEWASQSSVKDAQEKWHKPVHSPQYTELTHVSMQDVAETLRQMLIALKAGLAQEEDEKNIRAFVAACNHYLVAVEKEFIYDDGNFEVRIHLKRHDKHPTLRKEDSGKEMSMNMLSSGEKQLIALFSQLYLFSYSSTFLIIDETESSLSFRWQKQLLPDIIASNRCSGLVVVSHAPYICDNNADRYLHSIHEYRKAEVVR